MKKRAKIFFGALSIVPLILYGCWGYIELISKEEGSAPELLGPTWGTILMLAPIIITLIFMIHAWENIRLPREKRSLWVALIFFGGAWAMPIYYWFYIDE